MASAIEHFIRSYNYSSTMYLYRLYGLFVLYGLFANAFAFFWLLWLFCLFGRTVPAEQKSKKSKKAQKAQKNHKSQKSILLISWCLEHCSNTFEIGWNSVQTLFTSVGTLFKHFSDRLEHCWNTFHIRWHIVQSVTHAKVGHRTCTFACKGGSSRCRPTTAKLGQPELQN